MRFGFRHKHKYVRGQFRTSQQNAGDPVEDSKCFKMAKIKVVRNWTPHILLPFSLLLLFSHLTPQPAATSRYPTAVGLIFSFPPSFRVLFILTLDILLKPFQHCLSFALNWLKPPSTGPSSFRKPNFSIVCQLLRAAVKTGARCAMLTLT